MAKNIGSTFGDIFGNIYKGALSSLEGIWDFGAGIVGEVGGTFDKDFKKDVRAHIEKDWAGDTMTPWLDDLEKQSYIKEGSIVRDIASGVGGMLPAVATTVLTGGLGAPAAVASAAGTGVTMVGAAGQGTQESMKNGAGYDSALAYGTASGIVEGLTERLGGYTLGGGTSMLGKKIAGTSFGNAVSKGVGKFAFDAVSEGAEEVLADIADPTLKYLTGVDKNIGKNYVDTIKGLPKTFVTGAAVGSVMQGGSNVVSSIKNRNRGWARATRADNAVQNILEVTKNYKENDANNYKYDKAVKTNLETMSSELVKMKPEARKTYLDSVGVYKNAFDSETGKLKDNLVADTNRRAISANLRTISGTLTHKPLSGAETITQGAEKAKKTVERVVGTDATVVVTNELKADEKATFNPHDGVIYINNKADLTDEDVAKAVALHEVTHTTEGTKAYAKLVEQIESVINDKNAPESVKKIVGDIYKRQLSTASAYESEMESLNKVQTKYLVDTEVNADLIGDLLSDENFLDILANRDDGLLKKLYNSFTKRASIKKSELGPDGIKYLKKLANKFGKAIDKRTGGVKLSQLGGDDKKEVETVDDVRYNKDRSKAKLARYIPYDKIGKANVEAIRRKLQSLYAGTDNTVADGIAIEHKNNVYIVDSGKENGQIAFGVRKRVSIRDENLRSEYVRRTNSESLSKGHISDELSSKFGNIYDNNRRSDIGREFGEELSAYNGEPQNNKTGIFEDNGDRGRGVNSDERKSKNRLYDPKNDIDDIAELAETARRESEAAMLREYDEQYKADVNRTVEILDEIVKKVDNRTLPVANREYKKDKAAEQIVAEHERNDSFEEDLKKYNEELIKLNKLRKESADGFIMASTANSSPITHEFENVENESEKANQAEKQRKAIQGDIDNKEREKYEALVKNRQAEFEAIVNGVREGIEITYEFENSQSNEGMLSDVQKENLDRLRQLASEGSEALKSQAEAHKESVQSMLDTMTLEKAQRLGIEETNPEMLRNMGELAKMESILTIDPIKLEKTGKKPKEMYKEFFDSLGGVVHSKRFGDISLTNSSIRSEIRHGTTAEKLATIEAIPDVIQKGVVIFDRDKEAGTHRTVVCAPIKIGTQSYYMGVMIHKDPNTNRLYLHNVVSIEIKRKAIATPKADRVTNGALEGSISTEADLVTTGTPADNDLSMTIILQNALKVKFAREKNMAYNSKKTLRELIERAIYALNITDDDEKNFVFVTKKATNDVVTDVWRAVNSASREIKQSFIDNLAEQVLDNTMLAERSKYETLDYLKSIMHKLDLSAVLDELDASEKRKINARWSFKDTGSESNTIDIKSVIEALNMQGFSIGYINPVQAIIDINDAYETVKWYAENETGERLRERLGENEYQSKKKALVSELTKILEDNKTENELAGKLAFVIEKSQEEKKQHSEYRKEFKQDEKRNRAILNLLYYIRKIKGIKDHKYDSATQPKFDEFKGIAMLIGKMEHLGNINLSSVRELAKKVALWYQTSNPLLNYTDENHPGLYSKQIAETLDEFVNSESTERELSYGELRALGSIVGHLSNIIENHNKIFRGGKYVEAADVVKTHYEVLEDAEKNVPSFERMFLQNKYVRFFMDPMSVLATWDGHDPNGYFTTTYKDLVEGLINQRYDEMQALKELDEFRNDKKNKAYMKALTNGKDKIKIGGRIDPRKGTIEEIEVPKYIAIDLYMVSKTGQAIETLEETGYCIKLDGEHTQERMNSITRGQLEEMFNNFSEQDKKLISIMERAYNGICREMKYDTDMRRLGYSNVFEGYYYPINRINATDFDTNDFFAMMDRVSASSFNESRVHSKNAIVVSNALSKFLRHVNGVTKYKNLSIPIENMGIVFNLDISGDKHMPTSIKMKLQENDLWKGAEEYMKRLVNDVQNVGLNLDGGSKAVAWLRGSYAKFQLGANPKVWFSQLSSYLSAYGELRISSLTQAPTIKGAIKDSEVDKYCHLAAVRHYDKAATKAQAVTDKAGNVLTAPIEAVDRGVVKMLFAACQAEAKARFKLEIGTEENKIKAGEILTNVILRSQQNQLVTEQSGAMRSTSEIIKGFTMFNSDSMKQLSRLIQSLGEILTLKNKIKSAKASGDSALVKKLTAQKKQADTTLRKYCSAIVSVAVYMALLVKFFKWLYNKDDEEQPIQEWLFKEAAGNIVGMAPLIRDAYSFFNNGFEADIFVTSMANDVLKAFETTKNLFVSWVNGKDIAQEQLYSNIRSLTYSLGQLVGLPTRNIYNFTTGIIRRLDEGTGKTIDSFFRAPSENDAKESLIEGIEKNNERLIDYSLNAMYKKYNIDTQDKVLKGEMDRLIKLNASKDSEDDSNYNPLSFKIPEILEIDGEEVELSAEDRKLFKNKLNLAHKSSGQIVRTLMYKRMSDASKAYAIRKVYQYYDLLSRAELTGTMEKLVYFGDAVGVDILAQIMAYKYELNNATDEEKSKRTKSTKELITEYLSKFNLTLVQKSLVLRALGYNDKTNDALVRTFINRRYNLTSEQKAEFMQYASIAS